MASGEAANVPRGGDTPVNSETTVEIRILTMDSRTYRLRVDKSVPVPALKEQIASITGVLLEQQHLICRGRVLRDDQLLSAYHVEDGHTLHLVVRQPPQSSTPSTSHMGYEGTSFAPGSAHDRGSQVAHGLVFDYVNLDQGDNDASFISQVTFEETVPFYPGENTSGSMGPVSHGLFVEGEPHDAPFVHRRIRIQTRRVHGGSTNANELAGAQQQQHEQTDPRRNSSGENVVHQVVSGGDSGVQMAPLQTAVVLPSGVSTLPSESAVPSVRFFYPMLDRVRHTGAGNAIDARGAQASSQTQQGYSEVDWQPLHQSPVQRENLDSDSGGAVRDDNHDMDVFANGVPFVSIQSPNESAAHQGFSAVFVSSEEGMFVDDLLLQLMPSPGREQGASATNHITSAQLERNDSGSPRSPLDQRDPQ